MVPPAQFQRATFRLGGGRFLFSWSSRKWPARERKKNGKTPYRLGQDWKGRLPSPHSLRRSGGIVTPDEVISSTESWFAGCFLCRPRSRRRSRMCAPRVLSAAERTRLSGLSVD